MIAVGTDAPDFSLKDHFGRVWTLSALRGKRHALLFFYPLDYTPT